MSAFNYLDDFRGVTCPGLEHLQTALESFSSNCKAFYFSNTIKTEARQKAAEITASQLLENGFIEV